MMSTLTKLIEQAKNHGSAEDFQTIANVLAEGKPIDENELLDALRALLYYAPLKGYDDRYASFGEQYLHRTDMPFVTSRVLVMLCSYIYAVDKYHDYIKQALRGHTWDEKRDLQTSASVLAVDLFTVTQDKEIVCILIGILNSGQEERYSYTYEALLKIAGKPIEFSWRDWIKKKPSSVVDWALVQGLTKTYKCR